MISAEEGHRGTLEGHCPSRLCVHISVNSSFASGGLHVLLNGNVGQTEIVYCMDGTG